MFIRTDLLLILLLPNEINDVEELKLSIAILMRIIIHIIALNVNDTLDLIIAQPMCSIHR